MIVSLITLFLEQNALAQAKLSPSKVVSQLQKAPSERPQQLPSQSLLATPPELQADYCKNPAATVERNFPLPADVNYFIRSSPGSHQVGFPTETGNRILNVETGVLSVVPGRIDPVPSPDGRIIAIPEDMVKLGAQQKLIKASELPEEERKKIQYWYEGGTLFEKDQSGDGWHGSSLTRASLDRDHKDYLTSSMNIYDLSRITDEKVKPIFTDASVAENYQSIGVVDRSFNGNRYRMLYEGETDLMMRDLYVSRGNTVQTINKPRSVCKNPVTDALPASLPMISKDGKEFSVYVASEHKTKIYSIDFGSQECVLKDEIPAMVGKVDFSPDGKLLAFHIDATEDHGIFSKPGETNRFGIYIYNRETKSISQIYRNDKENGYYPVFTDDSHLAFVRSSVGANAKFSIGILKFEDGVLGNCSGCLTDPKTAQAFALLGMIRSSRCGNPDGSFRNSTVHFSSLRADSCAKVANSVSDAEIQDFVSRIDGKDKSWNPALLTDLNKSELKRICTKFTDPPSARPAATVR